MKNKIIMDIQFYFFLVMVFILFLTNESLLFIYHILNTCSRINSLYCITILSCCARDASLRFVSSSFSSFAGDNDFKTSAKM